MPAIQVTEAEAAEMRAASDRPVEEPRLTMADVDASIAGIYYFNGLQGAMASGAHVPGDHAEQLLRLTVCVVVLHNGFMQHGESYTVRTVDQNAQLGRELALIEAKARLLPILQYELKCRIPTLQTDMHPAEVSHEGETLAKDIDPTVAPQ